MNYGLPYKGSKNRIAKKILDVLPGLVRRRKAEAELYAQAGSVTVLFVGVIVMIAMGLAIAVFREMIL